MTPENFTNEAVPPRRRPGWGEGTPSLPDPPDEGPWFIEDIPGPPPVAVHALEVFEIYGHDGEAITADALAYFSTEALANEAVRICRHDWWVVVDTPEGRSAYSVSGGMGDDHDTLVVVKTVVDPRMQIFRSLVEWLDEVAFNKITDDDPDFDQRVWAEP